MSQTALLLEPEVEVACAACGEAGAERVCSSRELAAQLASARDFHRLRIRRRARGALEERASFTHDYATDLLACRGCGLLYRSPRPGADAVLGAYAMERYTEERLPQMVASQRALFRAKARALARRLGRGARVLEVGSFVGGFLHEARRAGLDAFGLDPSEQLTRLCASAGLRVARATLDAIEIGPGSARFDAVAIWNTFDQLPAPHAALAAAWRVLRTGGLLVLRVPHGECFRRWISRRRPPLRALGWNNLLGFPYLHGYGVRSLARLLPPERWCCVGIEGDVLGDVADASYARWARLEERVLKRHLQRRVRRDPGRAPWLDVFYRRAEAGRDDEALAISSESISRSTGLVRW
jgi:SAM-dependent methyltransferase